MGQNIFDGSKCVRELLGETIVKIGGLAHSPMFPSKLYAVGDTVSRLTTDSFLGTFLSRH